MFAELYGRYIDGIVGYSGRVRVKSVLRVGDDHPSLVIDLDSGLWYDFGLGEGGNFEKFERMVGCGVRGECVGRVGVAGVERELDRGWLGRVSSWWDELGRRGIGRDVFSRHGGYVYRDRGDWVVVIDYMCGYGRMVRWKRIRYRDGRKVRIDGSGGRLLYPTDGLLGGRGVIICEGELDCLALRSAGYRAVTSSGGAMGFGKDWGWMFGGKEVFLMFDDDDAGHRGMERTYKIIADYCRVVGCINWGMGGGYDVCDYIRDGGSIDNILGHLGNEYKIQRS